MIRDEIVMDSKYNIVGHGSCHSATAMLVRISRSIQLFSTLLLIYIHIICVSSFYPQCNNILLSTYSLPNVKLNSNENDIYSDCNTLLQYHVKHRQNHSKKHSHVSHSSTVLSSNGTEIEKEEHKKQSSESKKQSSFYYIRNAVYSELGQVANILIESFYNPSSLVRQYLYLSELSRLQGNFPYGNVEHKFFIACLRQEDDDDSLSKNGKREKETIIGFVDVDARPGTKESDAPRPYLSDLAVLPTYRRNGVAHALINECEIEAKLWGKEELYLRVERKNDGALDMYKNKLGYEALDHHYFGVKDTTILLRRKFVETLENKTIHDAVEEASYMI